MDKDKVITVITFLGEYRSLIHKHGMYVSGGIGASTGLLEVHSEERRNEELDLNIREIIHELYIDDEISEAEEKDILGVVLK